MAGARGAVRRIPRVVALVVEVGVVSVTGPGLPADGFEDGGKAGGKEGADARTVQIMRALQRHAWTQPVARPETRCRR